MGVNHLLAACCHHPAGALCRGDAARFRNPVLGGRHQGLCAPGTPAEKQHREAAQKHELHIGMQQLHIQMNK